MILHAAIDIRDGRVSQAQAGRDDPVAVARRWIDAGFPALHVVDLDRAFATGDNDAAIDAVLDAATVPVQVSGGLGDEGRIAALLATGAARVVTGPRAVVDPAWRERVARDHPGRVVLGLDARGGRVAERAPGGASVGARGAAGRGRPSPAVADLVRSLADLPLAAVLVRDLAREGRLGGVDPRPVAALARECPCPLFIAGGIRGAADLRALAGAGAACAVVGTALYGPVDGPGSGVAELGAAGILRGTSPEGEGDLWIGSS